MYVAVLFQQVPKFTLSDILQKSQHCHFDHKVEPKWKLQVQMIINQPYVYCSSFPTCSKVHLTRDSTIELALSFCSQIELTWKFQVQMIKNQPYMLQ